jgi:gamma-glutamyl:cysteine ligase YbdK (ATP-grasp superfamily)
LSHSIQRQVQELKDRVHHDGERIDETFKVGVEVEACLLDKKGIPVSAEPLIKELQGTTYEIDYEYGNCQFEYKTSPVGMNNLEYLNIVFELFIENLDKFIKKVYMEKEVIPVFLGANPSPEIMKEGLITNKPRYNKLAEWQNSLPDVEIEGYNFRAAYVATAIQGFHLHLQGKNPTNTAIMFNQILNIISSAIVLGANSRLFAGRVYSLHEPRIHLYDQSEQQNSGFPAIPRYLDGVENYIDYITSRDPNNTKDYFMLEKERHDDARIRIGPDSYRVETRIMSVQPTSKSLMAMAEFFIGYLSRAIHEERELRPLSTLREERMAAVRYGYNAKTHFNIIDTMRSQLDFARKGLSDLGISVGFLDILDKRLENRNSPGEYVAKIWSEKFNGSVNQTIYEIISDIWQKTKENHPIV